MTSQLVTTSTKRNPRSSIAGTAIWGGLSAVVISIASFCWVFWQSNCAIAVLSLLPLHLVSLRIAFHSIRTSLQIDFDYLAPRTVALITFLLLWILSMPFVALNPTAPNELTTTSINNISLIIIKFSTRNRKRI